MPVDIGGSPWMDTARSFVAGVADRVPPELLQRLYGFADATLTELQPYLLPAKKYLEVYFKDRRNWFNETTAGLDATMVMLATLAACITGQLLLVLARWLLRPILTRGARPIIFEAIRALPPFSFMIAREKIKMKEKILAGRAAHAVQGCEPLTALPQTGVSAQTVLDRLRQRAATDVQLSDGPSTLSGAVYMPAAGDHRALLDEAHSLFSLTNPLHPDAFPSVRQMEAEVVAMTAGLLGGGPEGANPEVCGTMTSGGTESILSAVKASRDFVAARRGITQPEMIIGVSAHAAYWKAAEYFKIRLHVVPVGRDLRLQAAAVRRRLNRNTVLLVASAPSFPHGLVDDVQGIARLAAQSGICCHVDACLGGFCLPFVRQLGGRVPPFDFSLRGVTSMSVDTHKFGMAHKGTSVVLYSSPQLRSRQYTRITEWSGGLYISPGLAGSRPGALIASAWAALVHLGRDGLLAATRDIMAARDTLVTGIVRQVPELEVMGAPDMAVVAFRVAPRAARHVNIYVLNDWLTERGWHLNALQSPPALHFCFTSMNARSAGALVGALRSGVDALRADPGAAAAAAKKGSAPVYGMSNVSPDRGMVGDFLVAYQDVMLMP